MDGGAIGASGRTERARFFRSPYLPGVEALHASFLHHRYPPHIHDSLTLAYVIRGAARFQLERDRFLAPADRVFVIPPQATHTGEAADPDGYSYCVLYASPETLAVHGGDDGIRFRWQRERIVMRNRHLSRALARVHAAVAAPADALEQAEALAGLAALLRKLTEGSPPSSRGSEHRAIRAARSHIDEHWREDFTLPELAAAVGLSSFHLCRLFTQEVGMPPSAYRRSVRIERARQLLRAGEPIARVAVSCGFYDQAHLTRHFKLSTGVTPARYARG